MSGSSLVRFAARNDGGSWVLVAWARMRGEIATPRQRWPVAHLWFILRLAMTVGVGFWVTWARTRGEIASPRQLQ